MDNDATKPMIAGCQKCVGTIQIKYEIYDLC